MTSAPRCYRSLIIVAASLVAWILILSLALAVVFDAGVSGGWILVGVMFSIAGMGVLLLTKELTEAIHLPDHFDSNGAPIRRNASIGPFSGKMQREIPDWLDPSSFESRRSSLGLSPRIGFSNRRRSQHRVQRRERVGQRVVEPVGSNTASARNTPRGKSHLAVSA